MAYRIWYMQIPEGLFGNWYNHTSSILVDKEFDPTTEVDTI